MNSIFTSVLPNNYTLKDCPYYSKVVDGIDFSFFVNDSETIDSGLWDFNDLVISCFDLKGNNVADDFHPLSKVDFGSNYRLYLEDANLTGLKDNGIYRNVIYDQPSGDILYIMPWFEFVKDPSPYVSMSYRNSSDIFNFSYEALPNFRNVIFLDLNLIDSQSELEREGYTEATTGKYRNEKSQVREYIVLESYFFDATAHAGMKSLSAHDDILINGREYTVKENYQVETNIRNGQAKGTIEFWDEEYNEINLNI